MRHDLESEEERTIVHALLWENDRIQAGKVEHITTASRFSVLLSAWPKWYLIGCSADTPVIGPSS